MAKFDNNMIFTIVLSVLAAFVLFALINYYNSKQTSAKTERFYQEAMQKAAAAEPEKPYASPLIQTEEDDPTGQPGPSDPADNEVYRSVDFSTQKLPSDCFPKDRLTAEDLLPKDAANNRFSQLHPAGQGAFNDVNLLSAGYLQGINTVGSTLRNANLQLRSEIPNPKNNAISPWQMSTIEPDLLRRPLEITGDC